MLVLVFFNFAKGASVLYLLAIIFPPGAVLMRGRIFESWFNAVLWALAIVSILVGVGVWAGPLCLAHALFVVYWYDKDRRKSGDESGA